MYQCNYINVHKCNVALCDTFFNPWILTVVNLKRDMIQICMQWRGYWAQSTVNCQYLPDRQFLLVLFTLSRISHLIKLSHTKRSWLIVNLTRTHVANEFKYSYENVVAKHRCKYIYIYICSVAKLTIAYLSQFMMTSSNCNIFRVTGHFYGEFTGPRWFPCTKASHAELWCFLWAASE